jgi:protein-S-isoprenylcysteine O-methyltransferase Ste14
MRDPKSPEVQELEQPKRQPISQRLLSLWVAFAYSVPDSSDPPRNTFLGWFRFLGMLLFGGALLGGSIWWIADGSYTDSSHKWHNEVVRGIQNPLYLGAIGLLALLYAFTLRPWKAPKPNNP